MREYLYVGQLNNVLYLQANTCMHAFKIDSKLKAIDCHMEKP